MASPIVGLGDGATHQAHGGNAGAITGADGQVAGNSEGFGRQGVQAHLAAPFVEETPLGTVDAPGVVGEDGLQGIGHPPGRRRATPALTEAIGELSADFRRRWSWGSP